MAAAWREGRALPSGDLIRVGAQCFVRDGHHRLSVAATLGAREVDALVTVWEVDGPTVGAANSPNADAAQPGYRFI